MLPGFRFLFATVVLSLSVLIFGLGAAALLRSAHEEFVGVPSWRAAQQPLMPAMDAGKPSLALLRVEPQEPKRVEAAKPDVAKPDAAKPEAAKIASIDAQATDTTVAAEKPTTETIAKPKLRKAKRTRTVKTLRHWRAPSTIQQAQQPTINSEFTGFGSTDPTASSGAGRNRRTSARSPF